MRQNFGKKLKEILHKLSGQGLKIVVLSVLLIYWGIMLMGTFLL